MAAPMAPAAPEAPGSGPGSPGPPGSVPAVPALVFGAAAARLLRERLRVCGRFVGAARRGRRGRGRGGARGARLPLQLRPEERALLRERADEAAAVGLNWDPPTPNGSPAARDCDPAPQRRFRVFRFLWGRGFHVTGGGKFGGDFLVYPGPPERFHAAAVVLCPSPRTGVPAPALVGAARLGSSARKTLLLCGGGAATSLQWRRDL